MSTPHDPEAAGGAAHGDDEADRSGGTDGVGTPGQYGPPPGYGNPGQYGPPPGYGTPGQYGPPPGYDTPGQYGPPPGYGTPGQYGAPSPFGRPGGPQLAGWGARVGAGLLDLMLFVVPAVALTVIGEIVGDAGLFEVLGNLVGVALTAWNLVRQGRTGQTVGKSAVGLLLLREADGRVVGVGGSIGRYFAHIVDGLPCYLGYLWPLWDAKKQTFADKIVKTVVIRP